MAAPPPPAAAAAAALARIDAVDVNHHLGAALVDVSASLIALEAAVVAFAPGRPMRIFGKVVAYATVNQRTSAFNVWRERNAAEAAKFTKEEWETEISAYGILTDAVSGAAQRDSIFHLATMPNIVFCHSFAAKLYSDFSPEARDAHFRRDAAWHEFAVLLRGRTLYIYDPSYDEDDRPLLPLLRASNPNVPPVPGSVRRRLNHLTMVGTKVADLITHLRTRRQLRVDKIYIGGGGNTEGDCRCMTLAWIQGRVRDMVLGQPGEDLDAWEELRP